MMRHKNTDNQQRRRARRSDRGIEASDYAPSIALRSIDGHIFRTGSQVWAWYRLDPQRWSFRSDSDRNQLISAIATQYSELQGRWLHLRVTSSPYPIRQWARAHVANIRDRLPDVSGAQSFEDYLVGEQEQLADAVMMEKEVYLGVQLQDRTLMDRLVDHAAPVVRKVLPEATEAELVALDSEITHVDQVLSGSGLQGHPVTASEARWLMHRSCTLGLPAPLQLPRAGDGTWATEDLEALTGAAVLSQEPYAPCVTVRGRSVQHAEQQRHVTVLSVGPQNDLQIPEVDEPWMQQADRLPVPLEWSARLYVRRPQDVAGELQRQANKVKSQKRHYVDEHQLEPPRALERQLEAVAEIDDAMTSGLTAQQSRVRSWWRVAVPGDSEKESVQRAQNLIDLYQHKTNLEHPEGQYALAREFIPGEPLASRVHQRRGSVTWAASAVPQATADVGDRRGVLVGTTAGATRRPVAWDPWMSQETGGSGLSALVGGLGAGKSFLGGGLVYKTMRAGAHWTVLDPSGPLSRLAELPELRPYARAINLLHAQPGILNPYRVVPDPSQIDYVDSPQPEKDWLADFKAAQATRRRLVQDVLTNVLPLEIARLPETKTVLLEAVQAVGGRSDAHPGLVIDQLARINNEYHQHAKTVHNFLNEVRERLSLLIPDADADPYTTPRDDRLTVLTLAGLTLPKDGVAREEWSDQEALAVELLNLSAWLTRRSIYEGPPGMRNEWQHVRKGVWIDEAFFLSEVPTGRVLMNQFARDSRKWNVRVLLSSQLPSDFLRIQGFASLVDSVFVGRLDDDEVQSDALRLLKVPTGVGYESVLGQLGKSPRMAAGNEVYSPRDFLFRDRANGGVERIRVSYAGPHLQQLRQALDTNPGQHQADEVAGGTDGDSGLFLPDSPGESGLHNGLDADQVATMIRPSWGESTTGGRS